MWWRYVQIQQYGRNKKAVLWVLCCWHSDPPKQLSGPKYLSNLKSLCSLSMLFRDLFRSIGCHSHSTPCYMTKGKDYIISKTKPSISRLRTRAHLICIYDYQYTYSYNWCNRWSARFLVWSYFGSYCKINEKLIAMYWRIFPYLYLFKIASVILIWLYERPGNFIRKLLQDWRYLGKQQSASTSLGN